MLTAANWKFYKLKRKVWFWVCAYAILGALTALLAVLASRFVPEGAELEGFGSEAVFTILSILASSMLAVTTFSLSIMVQAFGSASTGATPRSTSLLMSDATTQIVLSTFLGAFVYSIVGIIGLQSSIYGEAGRLVLFWVTLLVLFAVLWQLVRWISHLSHFGRLGDTIDRVEAAVQQAIDRLNTTPLMGGRPVPEAFTKPEVAKIYPKQIGYIEHIDVAALNKLAEEHEIEVQLCDLPGGFVHPKSVVMVLYGNKDSDAEIEERFQSCISVMRSRTFEQDPRFGVVTLSEIAARALSPAVNDSGTAIDIIGRFVRILSSYDHNAQAEPQFPHVYVQKLEMSELMEDAFLSTIRDAGGVIEVHLRIQKTLLALLEIDGATFADNALIYSDRSLAVCEREMAVESDIERVRKLNAKIHSLVRGSDQGKAAADG